MRSELHADRGVAQRVSISRAAKNIRLEDYFTLVDHVKTVIKECNEK